MAKRLKTVLYVLVIVILFATLFKVYADNVKAQVIIGEQLNADVNDMSVYVKGVKDYISKEIPSKPLSEKNAVTKEALTFYSGSANVYYMKSSRIQLTQSFDPYFGTLGTKLNELALVWNDSNHSQRQEQLMKETFALLKMLDKSIDQIQKAGEDQNGVNYRLWYSINNDPKNPIYKDLQSIVNENENEWGFLKH